LLNKAYCVGFNICDVIEQSVAIRSAVRSYCFSLTLKKFFILPQSVFT